MPIDIYRWIKVACSPPGARARQVLFWTRSNASIAKIKHVAQWPLSMIKRIKANYISLHYAVIGLCSLLLSSSLGIAGNLTAMNCILLGFSTCTNSGLTPVDINSLELYQQILLSAFSTITNAIVLNILVVGLRIFWFHVRMDMRAKESARSSQSPLPTMPSIPMSASRQLVLDMGNPFEIELSTFGIPSAGTASPSAVTPDGHVHFADEPITRVESHQSHSHFLDTVGSIAGVAGRYASNIFVPHPSEAHPYATTASSLLNGVPADRKEDILRSMREHPGEWEALSEEYRALLKLFRAVCLYPIIFNVIGTFGLLLFAYIGPAEFQDYLASEGINRGWWAFFTSSSLVNNLGLTLTPDSTNHLPGNSSIVCFMSALAFVGSAGYPIVLRMALVCWAKVQPNDKGLQYLLEYPRRCYTLLFPARDTIILAGTLFSCTFLEVILIIALDTDNSAVTHYPIGGLSDSVQSRLTAGQRFAAALFQAVNTRHTGMSIFNISAVNSGVLAFLEAMMFIAAYPLAASIRKNSTYDEGRLEVHREETQIHDGHGVIAYLKNSGGNLLTWDAPYIALGYVLITSIESRAHANDPEVWSMSGVLFESISAYCNVGLSLGHTDVTTSLCGEFTPTSKIVICGLMYRGRHRGLPYDIDRAVVIPGDELLIERSEAPNGEAAQPAAETV